MKKLLSIFLISIILMGCEKEEENCNCGVITNDEILDDCYSLTIKSDCSNNNKTFWTTIVFRFFTKCRRRLVPDGHIFIGRRPSNFRFYTLRRTFPDFHRFCLKTGNSVRLDICRSFQICRLSNKTELRMFPLIYLRISRCHERSELALVQKMLALKS